MAIPNERRATRQTRFLAATRRASLALGALRRRKALVVNDTTARFAPCTASQSEARARAKQVRQAPRSLLWAGLGLLMFGAAAAWADKTVQSPRLGKPISAEEATKWDRNVFPDGRGLPAGRGTAIEGRVIFDQKCAGCHGDGGRGATAEELAGGTGPLNGKTPDKTIGLYWPYATTIFDFTRRAMPMNLSLIHI